MKRSVTCDVAVIGAGPAGLAAARAAAGRGLEVVLVDAFIRPGGQYHMQPSSSASVFEETEQVIRGKAAVESAVASGVTMLTATEVWGVFDRFVLHAWNRNGAITIGTGAIVVASGAHDRTIAFPGWTLPGVMTPGAAQRLAKTCGVPPGRRSLLAGSGPFLLPVAGAVLKAGGRIAEIVEARSSPLPLVCLMLAHPERWAEGFRLLLPLVHARTRFRFGEVVVSALGKTRVEAAELAPLDATGRPDNSMKRIVGDIDSLLVGYGFQPQIDLTCVLGCHHRFDEAKGGWHCVAGLTTGATDVAGVFAAGEVCGVAGAIPAALSGTIAGLGAAEWLRNDESQGERRRLLSRARRAGRFADRLNRHYAPVAGLADLMTDETIVCRCEDVTAGEIRAEIARGVDSAYGAKLWTRAGMGPCQGRICGWSLARLIAAETGRNIEEIGFNRPRLPIRPVPLGIVRNSTPETHPAEDEPVSSGAP